MSFVTPWKTAVKKGLFLSGWYAVHSGVDALKRPGPRLVILVYHNVSDGSELRPGISHAFNLRPILPTRVLELHLRMLRRHYEIVSLREGLARLFSGEGQSRMVAITFDDGYRSFLELAFPLLESYGAPATVFLPTDYIGEQGYFWWDRLNQLVHLLSEDPPGHESLEPLLGTELALELSKGARNAERAILALQNLERSWIPIPASIRSERLGVLENLVSRGKRQLSRPEPVLSWQDVQWLSRRGVDFQSHTCTHIAFGTAGSDEIERELRDSKARIEHHLDQPVTGLAFPYGADLVSYRKAAPLLERCGYSFARTTAWACNTTSADPYLLHRGHMDEWLSPTLTRRDLAINFLRRLDD